MALVIAIVLHAFIWQYAETRLLKLGEELSQLVRGRPVNQVQRLDSDGIPYQTYADGSQHYNPLFVASVANQLYEELPDSLARARFIKLSDWLGKAMSQKGKALWLSYDFDYPKFEMKAPWHSALAQAEAMTVCARRWKLTRERVWLHRSQALAQSLKPPSELTITMSINTMEDPGHKRRDGLWFMEYPGDKAPYVLNGHAAVLLELHRTWELTSDPGLEKLFDRGFRGLREAIRRFDKKGFSLYSAEGELAGRAYHQKHIKQLMELIQIRPDPELDGYLDRWQRSDGYPVIVQLFFNPRPNRILAFGISLILLWAQLYILLRIVSRGPH